MILSNILNLTSSFQPVCSRQGFSSLTPHAKDKLSYACLGTYIYIHFNERERERERERESERV